MVTSAETTRSWLVEKSRTQRQVHLRQQFLVVLVTGISGEGQSPSVAATGCSELRIEGDTVEPTSAQGAACLDW